MEYELKLEAYQGPLHKLLDLIEERKLEVTHISLAAVTEDFFSYLKRLKEESGSVAGDGMPAIRVLVDFIVVASRLVFIKSKSLLPDLELSSAEEEGIRDLEYRLRLYQNLKPSMRSIQALWRESHKQFGRGYFMTFSKGQQNVVFYPGTNVSTVSVAQALILLIDTLKKFEIEEATITQKVVSMEEEMQKVLARLENLPSARLSHLGANHTRSDLIVLFLALLHLARDQSISLAQEGHFSDIIVEKK